jgi:hypothetical protein
VTATLHCLVTIAALRGLHVPPQQWDIPAGQCTVSASTGCAKLISEAFRRVPTNGVATTVTRHEPNRAYMGRGGEVHSHPRTCMYKGQGALRGCPDGMAQHLWSSILAAAFRRAGGVLHDTGYLSDDFWHFSVYEHTRRSFCEYYSVQIFIYLPDY